MGGGGEQGGGVEKHPSLMQTSFPHGSWDTIPTPFSHGCMDIFFSTFLISEHILISHMLRIAALLMLF